MASSRPPRSRPFLHSGRVASEAYSASKAAASISSCTTTEYQTRRHTHRHLRRRRLCTAACCTSTASCAAACLTTSGSYHDDSPVRNCTSIVALRCIVANPVEGVRLGQRVAPSRLLRLRALPAESSDAGSAGAPEPKSSDAGSIEPPPPKSSDAAAAVEARRQRARTRPAPAGRPVQRRAHRPRAAATAACCQRFAPVGAHRQRDHSPAALTVWSAAEEAELVPHRRLQRVLHRRRRRQTMRRRHPFGEHRCLV